MCVRVRADVRVCTYSSTRPVEYRRLRDGWVNPHYKYIYLCVRVCVHVCLFSRVRIVRRAQ